MIAHSLRVVLATAKVNLIMTKRLFNMTGFALRFFGPILILSATWILYTKVYQGVLTPDFENIVGGSGYVGFIIIGNAFYVFVFASSFVVGRVMFWERVMGTIEATFMTPMNRLAYMAGVMLAAALNSFLDFAVVFLLGVAFGFRIVSFNIPLLSASLLLTVFSLFGIGLLINAITLTFRDRTLTSNIVATLFMVFSGIVCPVELMPHWAQVISRVSPLTYGIRLMRSSLLGTKMYDWAFDLVVLSILGIIYVLAGSLTIKLIERNLKRKALLSVF
jgi:ABC-2 type transport system permease protein